MIKKISTLGPEWSNSHAATIHYMEREKLQGDPILCETPSDSFELLLKGEVDMCLVCNLQPNLHEIYLPNILEVEIKDVLLHHAKMGIFTRKNITQIKTVAAHLVASVFLHGKPYKFVSVNSNSAAAELCAQGKVDAAIATNHSAEFNDLVLYQDIGRIGVPYTIFIKI
jgi:prephenate dehydratase